VHGLLEMERRQGSSGLGGSFVVATDSAVELWGIGIDFDSASFQNISIEVM